HAVPLAAGRRAHHPGVGPLLEDRAVRVPGRRGAGVRRAAGRPRAVAWPDRRPPAGVRAEGAVVSDDASRVNVGTVEDLHASASRAVGLEDFGDGDDRHREALGVLLDSLHSDAGLTPAGSKYWRSVLKGALVARLLAQSGFAAAPAQAEVEISRP